MYLATLEDEDGMWLSDPIATDTREEAERIAREQWQKAGRGHMVLYSCQEIGEIQPEGKKDEDLRS